MKKTHTLVALLFTMSLSFGQTVTTLWSYPLPDKMGRTASPAVGSNGTIYIGCSLTTRIAAALPALPDPNFFAINPNGTLKWQTSITESNFTKPDDILSSASISADGTIFMSGLFGRYVFKLNPDDGSKIASNYINSRQRYTAPVFSSDGNSIYVCGFNNNDKGVRSLSADLAIQNWVFKPGGVAVDFNCTPAVAADGTIYAASANATVFDNKLYAINPDGTQKWVSKNLINFVSSAIAIGSDGTIYLSAKLNTNIPADGVLKAYNPADGSEKWSVTLIGTNAEQGGPAIAPNGTIYLGNNGGVMKAYNPANGAELWSFSASGGIEVVPAIDNLGRIYFGTTTGNFYVLNSDGTQAYDLLDLGDSITSSVAIGLNGTIYVAATDAGVGKLFALQTTATSLALGRWPMYGGNTKHSANVSILSLSTKKDAIDGFSIYPNPIIYGEFYISTFSNQSKSIQIFDLFGKQVYSKKIEANEKVKISNLAAGTYILKAEENGKLAARKLIIN